MLMIYLQSHRAPHLQGNWVLFKTSWPPGDTKSLRRRLNYCSHSHLPRCGLKGIDSLLESWGNWPNPPFPTPPDIEKLRAFLGGTGFCRICIPRYAALARPLFMLLLILLYLARFISQQVQQIKLQLFSQGILTSVYTRALQPVLSGDPGDYIGQPLRQVPPPL
jgi:hypothetical protein